MADAGEELEELFQKVVSALERQPGVTCDTPGSKLFGHSALKVNEKIFAMVSSGGHFVVKLPKSRVDVLEASGVGKRFEASRGQPMKEWLEVRSTSHREWLQLATEALHFVGTLQ